MKIHLLSDIHLEFGPFNHRVPDCDVVILSGDIGTGIQGIDWAANIFSGPVIYVPGNHEFYHTELFTHISAMRECAMGSNVHFLYNDSVIIDGYQFIGTTMWTDFNLYGNMPMGILHAQADLSDYNQIMFEDRMLKPADTIKENMFAKAFLSEQLAAHNRNVVVTHHAPSELSMLDSYRNNRLNPAYASRMENMMLEFSPVLWTHGHLHNSVDYEVGDTRIVCNPRGYVGEALNADFDPELVITV